MGHVDSTGEAYFIEHHVPILISTFNHDGLLQNFSPSFFKSFSVDGDLYPGNLSGVGHEVPQQNQADFLEGKCVVLPLRSYQILDDFGSIVENVHPRDDLRDCVSFTTTLVGH